MIRVEVPVPGHGYDAVVGSDLLGSAATYLPPFERCEKAFVVSDRMVADLWLAPVASSLTARGWTPIHIGVPLGEEAKSLQVAEALFRQLATQEAHRDDVIVALGGGAVGDLAGFVAHTYMRGLAVVQVPTTLTAQVDAAIGGKTAVNLPEGKNLVGAYHQPSLVLADVDTLASLPERDFRSGLAEVAKYALTLDEELLAMLETDSATVLDRQPVALEPLVARCIQAKAAAVASDERDTGARLILNYGHTFAHAIERCERYEGRSHGEAVAVGMVAAARLSETLGRAPAGTVARHLRLLSSLGLDVDGPLPPAEELLAAMRLDKKYHGGMRFVLLDDILVPVVVEGVPEEAVRATLIEMGASA